MPTDQPQPLAPNAAANTVTNSAPRSATIRRTTSETDVRITLNLDGSGRATIATGIPFLDHMLSALARHARLDLDLACTGDLHIDDHHSAEDCAIALGQALAQALGPRTAIVRFAHAYAPLDEALARCVIDLVSRPVAVVSLGLTRERLGTLSCENIPHFFRTLAAEGRFTLHIDVLRGDNDHHRAEAAFKALALALRQAIATTTDGVAPSTKGTL